MHDYHDLKYSQTQIDKSRLTSPVKDLTTSRSPARNEPTPRPNISKINSSKNVEFFVALLSDLYVSCAGILRHCGHSVAKIAAKKMFDSLQDLKDEHYQLRGDLSDKVARELRSEHEKVNQGLKDIRQNVGANYAKGKSRLKNGEENLSPNRVRVDHSIEKKDDAKYSLLLRKFNDLQKDYEILKVHKQTQPVQTNQINARVSNQENSLANEKIIAGYFNSFTGSALHQPHQIVGQNLSQRAQNTYQEAGTNPQLQFSNAIQLRTQQNLLNGMNDQIHRLASGTKNADSSIRNPSPSTVVYSQN